MNTDKMKSAASIICVHRSSSVATVLIFIAGCAAPNSANIQLRKQNQSLRDQIAQLNRRHEADDATIKGLENGGTAVQVLPTGRTERLFTVHGLKLGRLTGGADLDPAKPGDDGIKIYIVPIDDDGDSLKAA